MENNEKVIQLIKQNITNIRDGDFKAVYASISKVYYIDIVHLITRTLEEAGYDVVLEMGEVPPRYLTFDKNITSYKCPSNCKVIGRCAFRKCFNLNNIDLNDGLEEIKSEAFAFTAIKELVIPKTIRRIEYAILGDCDIERIRYEGTMEEWKNVDLEDAAFGFCNCSEIECIDGTVDAHNYDRY